MIDSRRIWFWQKARFLKEGWTIGYAGVTVSSEGRYVPESIIDLPDVIWFIIRPRADK